MIKNSFIILPGIGKRTEENLWNWGIKEWRDFLNEDKIKGISSKRKVLYDQILKQAQKAILSEDSSFFIDKLPTSENHRLYHHFKDEAVFLDIEVEHITSDITIIGLFDGFDTKVMVKDYNLDLGVLKRELQNYKLLVTYNGSTFDIPFLSKKFPDLIPNIPHLDLKTVCQRKGYKGGLKEIEEKMDIKRDNEIIQTLKSGEPYQLYRMWKGSGDDYYLNLLVKYNEEDVINLKTIADKLC